MPDAAPGPPSIPSLPWLEVGEAYAGRGAEAAHCNTLLGVPDGPVGTAWATALATPRAGHVPFVCVLRPDLPTRPLTLFVNKATLAGAEHERLTWGPAQAGVAAGVADAVADGTLDAGLAARVLCIAAVWIDPAARDAEAVFANNRVAVAAALARGRAGEPDVAAVLAARHEPQNPYFSQSSSV